MLNGPYVSISFSFDYTSVGLACNSTANEMQIIHSTDRVHRRIMHFLSNELIIMMMSSFNASICTMNSHTYVELLLLWLSYLFDSYIHPSIRLFTFYDWAQFIRNESVRFPIGPVQFGDRWQFSDHFLAVISLHCIFWCIFLILVKSYIVSVIFCRSIQYSVDWNIRSFILETKIKHLPKFILFPSEKLKENLLQLWIAYWD